MAMLFQTAGAQASARNLGLDPTDADWRAAFLAITAAIVGQPSNAEFLAPARENAERWKISLAGKPVVVIYDPSGVGSTPRFLRVIQGSVS